MGPSVSSSSYFPSLRSLHIQGPSSPPSSLGSTTGLRPPPAPAGPGDPWALPTFAGVAVIPKSSIMSNISRKVCKRGRVVLVGPCRDLPCHTDSTGCTWLLISGLAITGSSFPRLFVPRLLWDVPLGAGVLHSHSPKGVGRDHRGVVCSFLSQVLRAAHTPMGRIPHYPWPGTAVHLCPRRSKGIPAWDHSVWDGASCPGCG